MIRAELQFDPVGMSRSSTGLVIGGLRVRIGDVLFPHEQWTDFVVVVLRWWADTTLRLLAGHARPMKVRFMEGPHFVELDLSAAGALHVRLVDDALEPRMRAEGEVALRPFIESVLGCCEAALEKCREHDWRSSDTDVLALATERLRDAIAASRSLN